MTFSSIQVWGDSILKGIAFDSLRGRYVIVKNHCVAALAARATVPVCNHSKMGSTAPEALSRLAEEADASSRGSLTLIEYGGNDCDMPWEAISKAPTQEHLPNTPFEAFQHAMAQLVAKVRSRGAEPMLVIPPPLHAERYFDWVTRELDPDAILTFLGDRHFMYRWQERYAQAVFHLALRLGCPLIDLRDAFLKYNHYEDYLCQDGIHPNEKGHRVMLDCLSEALLAPSLALG